MVFSSLFFLYLFLPLNLICYFFAPSLRAKNIVMLIFSLVFYAWGEPVYLFLLLGMAFFDWIIAIYIGKQVPKSTGAKLGIVMMCLVNLGLLSVFKYGTFFLSNIKAITGFPQSIPNILLPIGISFYTFQLMSYVIDVYRKETEAQKNYFKLLLYVSLFHQCIAGPIVRYKDVENAITERSVSSADISYGVWRFTIGLAKKSVLANVCGAVADSFLVKDSAENAAALLEGRSVVGVWVGVLAYMLQIYLDFSAYSDMAIGMGKMIGFHYIENFNYPYMSRSVSEFWRRWHISLGSFFRDYLYIPLGGNRKGIARTIINLFVVWFFTGMWHGASWNFVLWGLYFFVFIALERLFLSKLLEKNKVISHIYLLVIIYFGWILFRFRDMNLILVTLKSMFGLNGNAFYNFETNSVLLNNLLLLLVSLVAATPLLKNICNNVKLIAVKSSVVSIVYSVVRIAWPIILLLLSTASLVGDSYNPFLYFQF
ncbi:MAG: MBOAT family protein [Ruminococcaceae bacterium]|nr:MBOAT family protein [Oscillospiraceae bacterium]